MLICLPKLSNGHHCHSHRFHFQLKSVSAEPSSASHYNHFHLVDRSTENMPSPVLLCSHRIILMLEELDICLFSKMRLNSSEIYGYEMSILSQ